MSDEYKYSELDSKELSKSLKKDGVVYITLPKAKASTAIAFFKRLDEITDNKKKKKVKIYYIFIGGLSMIRLFLFSIFDHKALELISFYILRKPKYELKVLDDSDSVSLIFVKNSVWSKR